MTKNAKIFLISADVIFLSFILDLCVPKKLYAGVCLNLLSSTRDNEVFLFTAYIKIGNPGISRVADKLMHIPNDITPSVDYD